MRKIRFAKALTLCIMALSMVTASCGGGGGGSSGSQGAASSSSGGSGSGNIPGNGSSSITLAWDAPTENTDNSPLTDLAGYKIYYGTSSGLYSESLDVGNVDEVTISKLSSGKWCFVSTAYNSSGNESFFSEEICENI